MHTDHGAAAPDARREVGHDDQLRHGRACAARIKTFSLRTRPATTNVGVLKKRSPPRRETEEAVPDGHQEAARRVPPSVE